MIKVEMIVEKGKARMSHRILVTSFNRETHKISTIKLPKGMKWGKTEPIGVSDIPREEALKLRDGNLPILFDELHCVYSPGLEFLRLSAKERIKVSSNNNFQILIFIKKGSLSDYSYELAPITTRKVRGGEVIILGYTENPSSDKEVWIKVSGKKDDHLIYFKVLERRLSRGYTDKEREDRKNGLLI